MNAGKRDSVWKEGGEKKVSACEEKCASESNPKPRPKPTPSSADVAERGVASIGVQGQRHLPDGWYFITSASFMSDML